MNVLTKLSKMYLFLEDIENNWCICSWCPWHYLHVGSFLGCNLLFMHLCTFINKNVDKKCSTPNKLLSFISINFLGSTLKNWKLATTVITTNHLMEYRAYWMKINDTRPFSVECWCFINSILHPTSHLFYFNGTSDSCKCHHVHKNSDKSCYVMSSNKGS